MDNGEGERVRVGGGGESEWVVRGRGGECVGYEGGVSEGRGGEGARGGMRCVCE